MVIDKIAKNNLKKQLNSGFRTKKKTYSLRPNRKHSEESMYRSRMRMLQIHAIISYVDDIDNLFSLLR